ncbi:uncharacterized protein LOC141538151 [Cotesia typhae]|uniref:uncharacterized protein LOC141538151 n=1 Tax=Cotesia typhae TaxID=2053667 RepID=UPI003D68165D
MPVCFLCRQNFAINILKYHFDSVHYINNEDKKYTCAENSCNRSYNNYCSFQRHWTKEHNQNLELKKSETSASSNPVNKSKGYLAGSVSEQEKFIKSSTQSLSLNKNQNINTKLQVFKSLKEDILNTSLKMYKTPAVSRKQVQQYVTLSKSLVTNGLNTIKEQLININSESSGIVDLKSVTDLFDSFTTAFNELDTEHKRIKILKQKNLYFEAEKFLIGVKSQGCKRNLDGTIKKSSSEAYGYQFPLKTMFKKIFELPEVYDTILTYVQHLEEETSVISNFMQSKLWKRKIQDFESKKVFPIMLFCDDYETGNALGSHSGCNKLCGCYITLPCFPPHYQSSLETIFHALLFYSKDREKFGNAAVFRLLIDMLNDLETNGLELDLPHGKTQVYFKLGLIVGDNLGLHSILGFVENFNANYACRFCKMDKDQRSMASLEDPVYIRTKISYAKDLLLNDVSATGIKEESAFHRLNNFHVTENYSTDIMHDVFEGISIKSLDKYSLLG